MPFTPTAIGGAGASRFGVKFNTSILWLGEIADDTTLVPTEAEINAGTDLTCAVQSVNGFTLSDQYSDLPDLCSQITGRVREGTTLADSSLGFYLDSSGTGDAFDFFTTGDRGVLLHAPYGLEEGMPAVSWFMEVGSVLPPIAFTGGALVNVGFAPTAVEKITIPGGS